MKPGRGGHLYIKNRFGLHIDLIIVSTMESFFICSIHSVTHNLECM